jgi:hypothetical protein
MIAPRCATERAERMNEAARSGLIWTRKSKGVSVEALPLLHRQLISKRKPSCPMGHRPDDHSLYPGRLQSRKGFVNRAFIVIFPCCGEPCLRFLSSDLPFTFHSPLPPTLSILTSMPMPPYPLHPRPTSNAPSLFTLPSCSKPTRMNCSSSVRSLLFALRSGLSTKKSYAG